MTVVEKMQVWLIDVAIPGDSRIDQKEVKKITNVGHIVLFHYCNRYNVSKLLAIINYS